MFTEISTLRHAYARFLCLCLALFSLSAHASAPAPDVTTARYEVRFMEGMIDHHAMAVEMAQMCLERASHEELRGLCEAITEAQTAEIAGMQGWLSGWYGASYAPAMNGMGTMQRLSRLIGDDFEMAFLQSMIRHHRRAVMMAAQCLDRASHAELKGLCMNIVETQAAEIKQMRDWQCQWYGRCSGRREEAESAV